MSTQIIKKIDTRFLLSMAYLSKKINCPANCFVRVFVLFKTLFADRYNGGALISSVRYINKQQKKRSPSRAAHPPTSLFAQAKGKALEKRSRKDARFLTWISLFSYASYLRRAHSDTHERVPMKTQRAWNCGTSKCTPLAPLLPTIVFSLPLAGLDYYLFNIVWEKPGNYVCASAQRKCATRSYSTGGARAISERSSRYYREA